MQVTDVEDKITHASIGARETQSMGISASAEFFHVLSSSLYSDQKLAPVREIICNADDIHKLCGLDKPIDITLINGEFRVRDYGSGIAHEDIVEIYGTYGNSTKKKQSGQTGGFGLGSKSPFAYVDSFEVTSYHKGKKTIYRMNKSDTEANGEPSIVTVLSLPTEETGIEVVMKIHRYDMATFEDNILKVVKRGGINANLIGIKLETWEKPADQDWAVWTQQGSNCRIYLRYGAVLYPVQEHADFSVEYRAAINALSYIGQYVPTLVLFAAPDTISVAPSREQLTYSPITVNTIKKLLPTFSELIQGKLRKVIDSEYENLFKTIVSTDRHMDAFRERNLITISRNKTIKHSELISSMESLTNFAKEYGGYSLSFSNCEKKLIDEIKSQGKMHQSFKDVKVFTPEVMTRSLKIMSTMHRNKMEMTNLFVTALSSWQYSFSEQGYFFDPKEQYNRTNFKVHEYYELAQGYLVLTHRKQTMLDDLRQYNRNNKPTYYHKTCWGYRVSRKKEEIDAVHQFAKRIGFKIIDLTIYQEIQKVVKPKVAKPKDTRILFKETPEGMQYVSLANAKRVGENCMLSSVYSKEDPILISKPRSVVLIKSGQAFLDKLGLSFPGENLGFTRSVFNLWSAHVAIVPNQKLYDLAIAGGAKPLREFVVEQLRKDIDASKTYYAASATSPSRISSHAKKAYKEFWIPYSLYHNVAKHGLGGFTGELPARSERDEELNYLARQLVPHLLNSEDPIFVKEREFPLDKRLLKMAGKFASSSVLPLVDVSALDDLLDEEKPSAENFKLADTVIKFIFKHSEKSQ